MSNLRFTLLPAAFVLLASAAPAFADSAQPLGTFGDWKGYVYSDKAGKVCYAVSQPKKSDNAPKDRKRAITTVTHRPADKAFNEISIETGLTLKANAPAELEIGTAKFDLYAKGGTAWTRDDKGAVADMLKSKGMIARFNPAKGALVVDSYSLNGFGQAHAAIDKACNVK